jgi:hypothetical protein
VNRKTQMHHYPGVRSYGYPQGGQQQYPGLGESYPEAYGGYGQEGFPASGSGAPAKKNLLSGLNLNEINNLINRMGGIDGILNTMGKVQKLVSSVQQMAPMLKLVAGSFLSSKKGGDDDDEYDSLPRRRRRRKRRRSSTSGRRRKARVSTVKKPTLF